MPKQTSTAAVYDFTLFMNFDKTDYAKGDSLNAHDGARKDQVKEEIIKHCKPKWGGFQLERCPTTQNLHFQGRITLKERTRLNGVIKLFGKTLPWHFTLTSNEAHKDLLYVTKEDTRICGPWTCEDIPPQIITKETAYYYSTIKSWQKYGMEVFSITWESLLDSGCRNDELLSAHRRDINILYSPNGCQGRSLFLKFMRSYKGAVTMYPVNDYVKFMAMCCDKHERKLKMKQKSDIWIINMPKGISTSVGAKQNEMYAGIETLKDGFVFDPRYEDREYEFNSPSVVILTNHIPDPKLVSEDRWKIWIIDENEDLVPYINQTEIDPEILNEIEFLEDEDDEFERIQMEILKGSRHS